MRVWDVAVVVENGHAFEILRTNRARPLSEGRSIPQSHGPSGAPLGLALE